MLNRSSDSPLQKDVMLNEVGTPCCGFYGSSQREAERQIGSEGV